MIPDEAVEAAAKQMAVNDGDLIGWILYQADAQKVLEAAAPHLTRAAQEKAWTEGLVATGSTYDDNPYRKDPK